MKGGGAGEWLLGLLGLGFKKKSLGYYSLPIFSTCFFWRKSRLYVASAGGELYIHAPNQNGSEVKGRKGDVFKSFGLPGKGLQANYSKRKHMREKRRRRRRRRGVWGDPDCPVSVVSGGIYSFIILFRKPASHKCGYIYFSFDFFQKEKYN